MCQTGMEGKSHKSQVRLTITTDWNCQLGCRRFRRRAILIEL